jgi:SAM-dependent methyltransferase
VTFNEPELVAREYASEGRFAARRVAFSDFVVGAKAEDLAVEALAEVRPPRVLEVGCGLGDFAERMSRELDAEVIAVDVSPRMVELTRSRGLHALVADAESLPFGNCEFGAVVANWVLHHVPELERGLAEVDRVLMDGGRFVAATFSAEHPLELYETFDDPNVAELAFSSENGEEALRAHFARVERRDADGTVVFPDRASLHSYLSSLIRGRELADRLPQFDGDFRARSRQSVFVCDEA